MLASVILLSTPISAMNYYQVLQNQCIRLGQVIEDIDNIPLINKLINLLSIRIVATSCKECPGQTMIVLAGILSYILFHNESVCSVL